MTTLPSTIFTLAGLAQVLRVGILAEVIGPVDVLRVLREEGVLRAHTCECAEDVSGEGAEEWLSSLVTTVNRGTKDSRKIVRRF